MTTMVTRYYTLNFFLWGTMKNMVYETPVTSEEDHSVAEILSIQPGSFDCVHQSLHCQCILCNEVGDRQFKALL